MSQATPRTTKEISEINSVCFRVFRILNNLGYINPVLQRRILGGLSPDEHRSIVSYEAGKTLESASFHKVRFFYERIYLASLTISPYSENPDEMWLKRKGIHPFDTHSPLEYLIQNAHTGQKELADMITTRRLLILAENWGLSKEQRETISLQRDEARVYMLLFIGKALEILFPTAQERAHWMNATHPAFQNKTPVCFIGSPDKEGLKKVYHYLHFVTKAALTWTPRYDYPETGELLIKYPNQMRFSFSG